MKVVVNKYTKYARVAGENTLSEGVAIPKLSLPSYILPYF